MSIVAPRRVQRWIGRWPVLLPLYDGRECPRCGAVVIGRQGKHLHQAEHRRTDNWEEHVLEAIRILCAHVGVRFELDIPETPAAAGDPYQTVRVNRTDYDDDDQAEEDDDDA